MMTGAIREAFEECGVLLARATGESNLISGERLTALDPYRDQLNKNEVTLLEFLEREQLKLACDCLQHFAHWVTPPMITKRFDTYFYLVAAPRNHLAVHDGHEPVDSIWISPQGAIAGARDGTYTVIFLTSLNVELLGMNDAVVRAIEMAKARTIVEILPWTEQRVDGTYICVPLGAGYPYREQKMPDQQR